MLKDVLHEIDENMKRAQEIIRIVDGSMRPLRLAYYKTFLKGAEVSTGILDKLSKRKNLNQTKRNINDMKTLIENFVSALKNISDKVSEYKFNDYGIEKEFIDFYNYFNNMDNEKIKYYVPDEDMAVLTSISEKAGKIKSDLYYLKEKIS